MEMAIGGAAAAAGKVGGAAAAAPGKAEGATASGEYWSEALKSFLDHIPVSSVSGAAQTSPSPGTVQALGALVVSWYSILLD
jgi:hypothetical protein